MKNESRTLRPRTFLILAMTVTLALALSLPAHAKRNSVVIEGPGVTVEKKKGWFGTEKQVYQDALGNTYETKKGLFGRKSTQSNVFGSQVVRKGNRTEVTAPDGTPLVTKKKSWLKGEETRVNGNGMWSSLKQLFED